MTTVTLWVLVSLGWFSPMSKTAVPHTVVERFVTLEACQAFQQALQINERSTPTRCIQAPVYKP